MQSAPGLTQRLERGVTVLGADEAAQDDVAGDGQPPLGRPSTDPLRVLVAEEVVLADDPQPLPLEDLDAMVDHQDPFVAEGAVGREEDPR